MGTSTPKKTDNKLDPRVEELLRLLAEARRERRTRHKKRQRGGLVLHCGLR
jgi:hypothetical protein